MIIFAKEKQTFTSFSPGRLFTSGRIINRPIPVRSIELARSIKREEPGTKLVFTGEAIQIDSLIPRNFRLDTAVVAERHDQLTIGYQTPLEVFRGRLNYLFNGHHRALAAFERGLEFYPAIVLNTAEPTRFEAEACDFLTCDMPYAAIWQMPKWKATGLEPREQRLLNFAVKLQRNTAGLPPLLAELTVAGRTEQLRLRLLKLVELQDFDRTAAGLENEFGLNLSDLQSVCMLRDHYRQRRLYERLQVIKSDNIEPRLQQKTEGFRLLAEITGALIRS